MDQKQGMQQKYRMAHKQAMIQRQEMYYKNRVHHKTLNGLGIGEKSRIIAVRGHGAVRDHLLDMGLTPNTEIMVRKVAPMGDPIELMLRGYELTLRMEDAKNIEIEGTSNDICTSGKPELREDNAFQSDDRIQPACGQLSGHHRRAKRRGCPRA